MVQVRLTNGELSGWWANQDTPVGQLKGHWRLPIPSVHEPLHEQPDPS